MNILYIGDIMGQPGIDVVAKILPNLIVAKEIDYVIAQGENVTAGKGMSVDDMQTLKSYGVDFFSGGNHTPSRAELHRFLVDPSEPVIGPANLVDCPGNGWKIVTTRHGKILIISLMGAKVGTPIEMTSPLQAVDEILNQNEAEDVLATIVNFHGDYSSEKRVIGYYLDGRVTAVIGDHWHVPTADAMILPKGTGHITDVGMCGTLHSSLGVKTDVIMRRWKSGLPSRNVLETEGPLQFNALKIQIENNLAVQVEHIQQLIDY